jgi:signal transduction histidine kinase
MGTKRLRERLTWGLDLLLAAALSGSALYEIWLGSLPANAGVPGPRLENTVIFVLVGLALVLRRQVPIATLFMIVVAVLIQREVLLPPSSNQAPIDPFLALQSFLALLVAFYSAAAYAEPRRAAIGGALAGAAIVATDLPHIIVGNPRQDTVPSWIFMATLWLAGWAFRRRRIQAARLEDRAARLEREREERARVAVAEERARIARELHDVVAHGVSVIVVQAQAAQRLIDGEQHDARRALGSIETSGRQALVELRRMLGILRRAGEEPALDPQPGLGQLNALVEQFRESGLPVEVSIEGEAKPLPPGVDLSAYRIVQEALTNTLKHASPARARVAVLYRGDEIELEIIDDGARSGEGDGPGHGLIGMRERAALYGGVFESGKREGGGYFVRTRLPLGAPSSESIVGERTT